MLKLIYNGIKRLLFGSTSVFTVRNGSCPMVGNSFVPVHTERTKTPVKIVGIKFVVDPSLQGEWRVFVAGIDKVFPYGVNPMDSEFHHLMPIEIAAGELFCIEVRSRNQEYRGIAILEELDIIEMR